MFGSLGGPELFVIGIICLLLFGTGRLPELGKGLGEGIRNFKQAMREGDRGDDEKTESDVKADGEQK